MTGEHDIQEVRLDSHPRLLRSIKDDEENKTECPFHGCQPETPLSTQYSVPFEGIRWRVTFGPT